MTAIRIKAAKPMRQAAVVKVGSSFTMTACMKKEPPHNSDRAMSIAHSSGVISLLIGAIVGMVAPDVEMTMLEHVI